MEKVGASFRLRKRERTADSDYWRSIAASLEKIKNNSFVIQCRQTLRGALRCLLLLLFMVAREPYPPICTKRIGPAARVQRRPGGRNIRKGGVRSLVVRGARKFWKMGGGCFMVVEGEVVFLKNNQLLRGVLGGVFSMVVKIPLVVAFRVVPPPGLGALPVAPLFQIPPGQALPPGGRPDSLRTD